MTRLDQQLRRLVAERRGRPDPFTLDAEALEKLGAPFEAARVALERGDAGRAIQSLQQMSYDDGDSSEYNS